MSVIKFTILILVLSSFSLSAKTVEVCSYNDLTQKKCIPQTISCDFTERYQKSLNKDSTYNYLDNKSRITYHGLFKNTEKLIVYPGSYAEIFQRNQEIYTSSLFTCSSIAILDSDCNYASLTHYMQNNENLTTNTILDAYRRNCSSRSGSVKALLTLSSVDGYYQSLDSPTYRKLICNLKKEIPSIEINVLYSTKSSDETDSIFIKLQSDVSSIKIQRLNKNREMIEEMSLKL